MRKRKYESNTTPRHCLCGREARSVIQQTKHFGLVTYWGDECEQCRHKRRYRSHPRPEGAGFGPKRLAKLKATECSRCGFKAEDSCQLQVDHILPKWKGGADTLDNLQVLCANCHALKTKREVSSSEYQTFLLSRAS